MYPPTTAVMAACPYVFPLFARSPSLPSLFLPLANSEQRRRYSVGEMSWDANVMLEQFLNLFTSKRNALLGTHHVFETWTCPNIHICTLLEKVEKVLLHHRSTGGHIPQTVSTTATETERGRKQKREGKRIRSGGTHGRSFHSIVVRDGWILSETQSGTFRNSQSTSIIFIKPLIFVIIFK